MRLTTLTTLLFLTITISTNIGSSTYPLNLPYMGNGIDRLNIGFGRRPNLYRQPTDKYTLNDKFALRPRPYNHRNHVQGFEYSEDQMFRTRYNEMYRRKNGIMGGDDNRNYFPYDLTRNYPGETYRNQTRRRRLRKWDYMNYL